MLDFIGESNIIEGKMIEDFVVEFAGKHFECVDGGMNPNEPVEIVIRPEDLEVKPAGEGKLNVTVISRLFRGVHYEAQCRDLEGNEWLVHTTKKIQVDDKIGLDFDSGDIHVMRFNELEEDFDRRIEEYTEDEAIE